MMMFERWSAVRFVDIVLDVRETTGEERFRFISVVVSTNPKAFGDRSDQYVKSEAREVE